jgi:hypothetical protein
MTRRPRRNRPPLLPDHVVVAPEARVERPVTPPSRRARLVEARVTGRHAVLGRGEVEHLVSRLASGAPDAGLGLDLGPVSRDEAHDALRAIWGWEPGEARATIDPDRTLAALEVAAEHIDRVARQGGRVALATGRPASLLPVYRAVAAHARAIGAELARADEQRLEGPGGRAVWWLDGVAAVTDGAALLRDDGPEAPAEWLFAIGRPDLVVADQAFAAAAAEAGHETIALADLDGLALGVAARRGRPVCVVPLQQGRPPNAYGAVVEALTEPHAAPEPGHPHLAPGAQGSQSTT